MTVINHKCISESKTKQKKKLVSKSTRRRPGDDPAPNYHSPTPTTIFPPPLSVSYVRPAYHDLTSALWLIFLGLIFFFLQTNHLCIFVRLGDVMLGVTIPQKKKSQPNNLKLKTKNNYLNTAKRSRPTWPPSSGQ